MLTAASSITNTIKKKTAKRILLVDDEPDTTMAISIALKSDGYDVYSFNDPVLAESNFRADYYDLVILDIKMPIMDGFELYNKIKKTDSKVNVCFITAIDKSNYKGFEQKEQDIGVRQEKLSEKYCVLNKIMFLQKPISNKDLVTEINKRMRD